MLPASAPTLIVNIAVAIFFPAILVCPVCRTNRRTSERSLSVSGPSRISSRYTSCRRLSRAARLGIVVCAHGESPRRDSTRAAPSTGDFAVPPPWGGLRTLRPGVGCFAVGAGGSAVDLPADHRHDRQVAGGHPPATQQHWVRVSGSSTEISHQSLFDFPSSRRAGFGWKDPMLLGIQPRPLPAVVVFICQDGRRFWSFRRSFGGRLG